MELETFKITVLPLREKLFNISRRMMEDRSDAEDIVQETFLKLWQIREKLDSYNSVEALAIQVAKNLALDKLKQHRPEGTDITQLSLDSGSRNPAEELEQQDTVARIRWLIGKLPSLQQTIIRMKDVEGYELAEIAEITGTQVEAVRVNLSRARKKIREQLVKELCILNYELWKRGLNIWKSCWNGILKVKLQPVKSSGFVPFLHPEMCRSIWQPISLCLLILMKRSNS